MTRPVVDVMTGLDEEIGRLADIVTGPYTSTRESLRHRPHAVDNDAESMAQVKGHVNRPPAAWVSSLVVAAAEVLVGGSERELFDRLGQRKPVQPVLEDGVDVAIGADADDQGAGARGLEAGRAIATAEAEQPEAGAVASFGMRAIGEDRGDEGSGLGADGLRPLDATASTRGAAGGPW